MALIDIEQAFFGRIDHGDLVIEHEGELYVMPFAFENKPFDPRGRVYGEVLSLPNDVTPFSLKETDETDGIFRVIVRVPANMGWKYCKQVADTIRSWFPIGGKIAEATITGHSRKAGVHEDGWFKQVVTISYRAFIRRAS